VATICIAAAASAGVESALFCEWCSSLWLGKAMQPCLFDVLHKYGVCLLSQGVVLYCSVFVACCLHWHLLL
jgi:hypothetical protein